MANRYLVTGYGSIGGLITKKLVGSCEKLIIVDKDEKAVHAATVEYGGHKNVEIILCDLSRESELSKVFIHKPDVVIHTAALKHVNLCEYNPPLAVINNVLATDMLIEHSISGGVKRFIFINTDKSVYPTNTMGATKMLAEKCLISHSNACRKNGIDIVFNSLRFGNVLNSNGSLMPTIVDMVYRNLPIKITNPDATRYFVSPKELFGFINEIISGDIKDQIIIKKMKSVRLNIMIQAMLSYLKKPNHPCDIIGLMPGEKVHENLYNDLEAPYVVDRGSFIAVDLGGKADYSLPMVSSKDNCISHDEFLAILNSELFSATLYYSTIHAH